MCDVNNYPWRILTVLSGMRALFKITQDEIKLKFPEQKEIVVGAFYFLRYKNFGGKELISDFYVLR